MFMQDFTRHAAACSPVNLATMTRSLPVITGLVAGTLLETRAGWQPVESLHIGDAVQTLDGGMARLLGLDRRSLSADAQTPLIKVDGGCFDSCSDLLLLPGQHLLLDTLDDAQMGGAPFAMIAATALLASPGARRHAVTNAIEVITPLFADEEVVYANSGVLLHCPGITDGAQAFPDTSFFPRLEVLQARHFVQRRAARFAA